MRRRPTETKRANQSAAAVNAAIGAALHGALGKTVTPAASAPAPGPSLADLVVTNVYSVGSHECCDVNVDVTNQGTAAAPATKAEITQQGQAARAGRRPRARAGADGHGHDLLPLRQAGHVHRRGRRHGPGAGERRDEHSRTATWGIVKPYGVGCVYP